MAESLEKSGSIFDSALIPAEQFDDGYLFNKFHPNCKDIREVIERMWSNYSMYCPDTDFCNDAAKHFHGALWQMQVTDFLGKQKIVLIPVGLHGPDVRAILGDRLECLFETISARPGTGPDQVPEPPRGQPYQPASNEIVIRLRNALDSKIKQHARWVNAGIVTSDNPLIVCISAGEIPDAAIAPEIGHIKKALFPIDDGAFHVPIGQPGPTAEFRHGFRSSISKRNGSPVSTTAFVTRAAESVSAILYSPHHFINSCSLDGKDLKLIHNPNARNPIPHGLLRVGREGWVEEGEYRIRKLHL